MVDLKGKKFNFLTVLYRLPPQGSGKQIKWHCLCDCGNETDVLSWNLRSGGTVSCGCVHQKQIHSGFNRLHGKSKSRLYRIWTNMKSRCTNPNYPRFADWGGRGIAICDEWFDDFQAFYDGSMENGYQDDLTIDRINNENGYSPDNCRWATAKEQNDNRRCSR